MEPSAKRWYFSKQELEDSPSRRCGMDAEKELSNRQQAANFIQDMGQRLQVTQLCINTGIVYMHRFYCFHSFTNFHRNSIASAAIFLAAKVEEQPRKLEHIIKVVQMCLQKTPADRRSEAYQEQSQELILNENLLLMTLGFEVAIEHPHAFIVKFCHLANASKDLSHTSYFMASNSLHLTPMCVEYPPTVVACFCIYLACLWAGWQIPMSKENRPWFSYIDPSVTEELLERLTKEFLVIFDKCPSRLKKRMQNCQNGQGYVFDADRRHMTNHNQQHAQASSSSSSSSSSTKPVTLCAPPVTNGSKMHPSSSSSSSTSSFSNAGDNVVNKLPSTKNAVISPQNVKTSSSHPAPSFSGRPSQQHLSKSSNPHHANLPTSAIKPHTVSTAPSNVTSKHPSDALAHNVFTKDAGQRSEQRRAATDIKHEPGLSSAPPTSSSSSTVNNHHHHIVKPSTSSYVEHRYRRETAPPPPAPNTDPAPAPAPPSRANLASTSEHDIIQHVVKEVVSKQEEKQRLSSSLKSESFNVASVAKPTHENMNIPSSSKISKNPSIFSPPPVSRDDVTQLSPFDDRRKSLLKEEPLTPEMQRVLGRNASSCTSGERELIPAVKKEDDVAGLEKTATKVSDIEGSPKQELRDDRNSTSDASHSHKKKKKHKEKDKKHDKEKHRHKEKKKHKEDKYKKEHKEKRPSKEPETISVAEPVSESIAKGIKVTIRKDRLQINDIPKIKINLNNQVVTPSVSDSDENLKLKIDKDKVKSRKRRRDSDSEGSSKKFAYNGSDLRNGY